MELKKLKPTIHESAEKLLSLMGLSGNVSVEQNEDVYNVQVETESAGILIGRRGETISAFQLILRQIIYSSLKKDDTTPPFKVTVNVGDWLEKREVSIRSLVQDAIERTKASGEPQYIYDLTSYERRLAHMIVSEVEGVVSESEGEGRERHLIVKSS